MTIGTRLKELRLEHDMTLKEVADKMGLSEGTIQRYESDNIKTIPYESITGLADLFHCDPAYIMGWQKVRRIETDPHQVTICSHYDAAPESIKEVVNKLLDLKEGE